MESTLTVHAALILRINVFRKPEEEEEEEEGGGGRKRANRKSSINCPNMKEFV